jgi:hypothetical protein
MVGRWISFQRVLCAAKELRQQLVVPFTVSLALLNDVFFIFIVEALMAPVAAHLAHPDASTPVINPPHAGGTCPALPPRCLPPR